MLFYLYLFTLPIILIQPVPKIQTSFLTIWPCRIKPEKMNSGVWKPYRLQSGSRLCIQRERLRLRFDVICRDTKSMKHEYSTLNKTESV